MNLRHNDILIGWNQEHLIDQAYISGSEQSDPLRDVALMVASVADGNTTLNVWCFASVADGNTTLNVWCLLGSTFISYSYIHIKFNKHKLHDMSLQPYRKIKFNKRKSHDMSLQRKRDQVQ